MRIVYNPAKDNTKSLAKVENTDFNINQNSGLDKRLNLQSLSNKHSSNDRMRKRQGSLNAQLQGVVQNNNFAAERSELSNPIGRHRSKQKAQSSDKLPPLNRQFEKSRQ